MTDITSDQPKLANSAKAFAHFLKNDVKLPGTKQQYSFAQRAALGDANLKAFDKLFAVIESANLLAGATGTTKSARNPENELFNLRAQIKETFSARANPVDDRPYGSQILDNIGSFEENPESNTRLKFRAEIAKLAEKTEGFIQTYVQEGFNISSDKLDRSKLRGEGELKNKKVGAVNFAFEKLTKSLAEFNQEFARGNVAGKGT